jgi:addiction module HigA family antidote
MPRTRRIPAPTPGTILLHEFMEPLGLSARALAEALAVPPNRITGIVNGSRAVTADSAARLSAFFGTTPEFWLNLQTAHAVREIARAARGFAAIAKRGEAMRARRAA